MWEQSQYFFSILDHRRVLNQIPQDVSDITFCSTNQYFMVKKFFQPIYGQTLDHKQTKASLQSRADSRAEWKIVSPLEVCKWGMERGRKSGISNIPFTGWKLGWEGNGSSQGKPTTGHHSDHLSSSITRICWPSNMMSLFISCIPLMWTQGETTILCGYFLSHCILGYVCFPQEDHLAFKKLCSLSHSPPFILLYSFYLILYDCGYFHYKKNCVLVNWKTYSEFSTKGYFFFIINKPMKSLQTFFPIISFTKMD